MESVVRQLRETVCAVVQTPCQPGSDLKKSVPWERDVSRIGSAGRKVNTRCVERVAEHVDVENSNVSTGDLSREIRATWADRNLA